VPVDPSGEPEFFLKKNNLAIVSYELSSLEMVLYLFRSSLVTSKLSCRKKYIYYFVRPGSVIDELLHFKYEIILYHCKAESKKKDDENAHLNEIFRPTPVRVVDIDNIGQR